MPRDELRGLDAWIEGRHITSHPSSPYYVGPECFEYGDKVECPHCGAQPGQDCRYRDNEPDPYEPDLDREPYDYSEDR